MNSFAETQLANFHLIYNETGNPVFVWLAINICGGGVTGERCEIPDWCLSYLFASAGKIDQLLPHIENVKGRAAKTNSESDRSILMGRIPDALGLSAQGTNNLKNANSYLEDLGTTITHKMMTDALGLKSNAALEEIHSNSGITYDALQKKLRRGRKLMKSAKLEKPSS